MTESAWWNARESLPISWQTAIGDAFDTPNMHDIAALVARERAAGKQVFPDDTLIFAALRRTPLDQIKAVILGQDPYHRPGQAMGLSFSVPPGVALPPSLRNIYKELATDIGITTPKHGCLTTWADQGVLLLNTALTVEAGKAGSHARVGWHYFTDQIITAINTRDVPVAFLLWGGHAHKKAALLNPTRHLVHRSEHPSPLAAYRGFFGSRPFSRTNEFLQSQGIAAIDWTLPTCKHNNIKT